MLDLPDWAAAFVGPLLEACEADERFVGVTVNGSVASGTSDEFSDLDLVLVCRDGDEHDLLAEAPELAGRLGPLLAWFAGEHVGAPELLVCLYGPPLRHVDLKFVSVSGLATRVEDGAILWDRSGEIAEATTATTAVWPQPGAQWIEDRFWIWVHYVASKIGRGELLEAADGFAFLRGIVLGPLLAVRCGVRPQGVRRIERIAPDAMPALERTVARLDPQSCVAALRETIALYRELRDTAVGGPVLRTAAEEASVVFLDEIEARVGPNRSGRPREPAPTSDPGGPVSETNTEIVHRMVMECQSGGDLDRIDEFFSPDFVNHALFPGMTTDRDGVRMLFALFHRAFEGFHVEIHEHLAERDKVFTYKTLHGTHRDEFLGIPATGKSIAVDVMDVLRIEDGKLVEHWNVVDVAGLMRQLGVLQQRDQLARRTRFTR